MSKRKKKRPGQAAPAPPPDAQKRRRLGVAAAVVTAAGIVGLALSLAGREPPRGSTLAGVAAEAPPTTLAPAATASPMLDRLKGRWMRPDGGYVLEVLDIDAAGAASALYLNPRPIHVARAEARMDGAAATLFVELRAPNYPGSTYTLRYDPRRDQLAGVYFQAALQQRYDVVFARLK